jgi:MFS family permease
MTSHERRASLGLAALFGLRMLGLFMLLPVFALAAAGMPGGDDPALIGLALGAYGMTQALMQIPFGLASDRIGRRAAVLAGLGLFVLGSVICALAHSVDVIVIGRAIQGAGAISAAVTAWLADLTRDEVRARAMALVGASVGLSFALSLVLAPLLVGVAGLAGLFWTMACLGLAAMALAAWHLPAGQRPESHSGQLKADLLQVLADLDLQRLNLSIFSLHAIQMASFVVLPVALARAGGLQVGQLWWVYMPVLLLSFALMLPVLFWAERQGRQVGGLRSGVLMMALACLALAASLEHWWLLCAAFTLYFAAFNLLEALLPSAVSRRAPPARKGLALGVYNTAQAVGLFLGGSLGGWLAARVSPAAALLACAALAALWLLLVWRLQPLPRRTEAVSDDWVRS